MNAIHAAVRGTRADGEPYSALDPEALLWVHATLVDTALRVHRRFVAPLSAADEQRYHVESAQVAVELGVPSATIPSTIAELRSWMDARIASGEITVTPAARQIARTVLYPSRMLPRIAWDAAHLISLATLPARIRRGYGIRWSAARERGVERIAEASRAVLPLVPGPLRFAPHARAAQRRVARSGVPNPS